MNNEPAICPKCGEQSLIKEVTYGKQVTVGFCAFTKKCGYKIDRINHVETPLRAVSPPIAKGKEWWYEKSAESLHKLAARGVKKR
jgi:hypothetical protein